MFDVGFSELLVIGVVALVVLGPERLPKVARTAGLLFGRLQRYVATVKADLNREMDLSELAKMKQEVQEAARAFEQSAQQQTSAFESDARGLGEAMKKPAADAIPRIDAGQSQAELLMAQEQGLLTAAPEPSPAPSHASAPAAATTAPGVASSQQGTLDLGIEPPRTVRA